MVDRDVVRGGYDDVAETYGAERSGDGPGRAILEEFLGRLGDSPHVLDAGCGQGRPVLRALADVGTATGLDFSRGQLQLAGEHAPRASLVQGDLTALPFGDGVFDAVTAYHSLIHVPLADHRAVVEAFARVLRPGGRVLLTEGPERWTGTNPDWLDTGTEMQWHVAGAATTREQLRAAGFAVESEWVADGDDERWVFFAAHLG